MLVSLSALAALLTTAPSVRNGLRGCSPFAGARGWSAVLLAATLLFGCASEVEVRTARDPSVQLTQFHSFAMLLPNKALPSKDADVDPFVFQRLRQLTYQELKALGLTPTDKSQADLLVGVWARRSQRIDVYPSAYYGYGYGPPYSYGYWSPAYRGGTWSSQVVKTNEAIVVLDLIDRKKQAVVWRGTGVRTLEGDFDDETLTQMVGAILAEAPVARAP